MESSSTLRPLEGFRVAVTADRRAKEQGELLRHRGAEVVYAPTITTGYLSSGAATEATEAILEHPPDLVIANTAIGMRAWIESAQSTGEDAALLRTLKGAQVIARGPKAASACHVLGIPVEHEVSGERLDAVLVHLLTVGVGGRRIAFQSHGAPSPGFVAALVDAGADVVEVDVYRYARPDDVASAHRLVDSILDGRIDAVTFTSRPAVDNLFHLAGERGLDEAVRDAFNGGVVAACVGPVCGEAALGHGIAAPLYPGRGRIGLLVRALADALEGRSVRFEVDGFRVTLQGAMVVAGAARVELTRREAAVLALLARRPGAVVPAASMLDQVWGGFTDTHVVEVTVGRLRRRLSRVGLRVVSVPGRGYRLAAHSRAEAM